MIFLEGLIDFRNVSTLLFISNFPQVKSYAALLKFPLFERYIILDVKINFQHMNST